VASANAAGAPRAITVALDAPTDAVVEGDALLLQRAVGNLLDNALDFSPDGGRIEVTLIAGTKQAEIRVRDHGPGIPDYADERVFEKFYSLARPGTQRRSTGLGLPFVREIASLHEGRVTLRNAPEGGALATVVLPTIAA
jgi:two-component system sensor histidine kinase CreC